MSHILCRRPLTVLACALVFAAALAPQPVAAGGSLQGNDFTDFANFDAGPVPGSVMVPEVPIRWDARCLPVRYRFNNEIAANSSPALDDDATRAVLQRALDRWNDIATSYIDLQMTDSDFQRPRQGPFDFVRFDFVNEVNFLSTINDPWLAISPSVSNVFSGFYTAGTDLDGDGDSDFFDPVAEGIEVCADVDGDGDNDFPAGFYPAGTLWDNDVSFNNGAVWTTGTPTTVFGEADLEGTAVHEFGHSQGLAHSGINQHSAEDGSGATMFPFVFTNQVDYQEAIRTPSSDDVAWSSFTYPEGSADEGPAALQEGDVAFDAAYGVISGDVLDGELGLPLAGGHLFAIDRQSGEIVSGVYTGQIRHGFIPGVFFGVFPDFPEFHLVGSEYQLPVPVGHYHLAIEAFDGTPVGAGSIEFAPIYGATFGQLDFNEQYLTDENHPKFSPRKIHVKAGETVSGVDHTIREAVNLDGFDLVSIFGNFDLDQLGFSTAPPETVYAVEIPADEVALLLDAGLEPTGAAFRTWVPESVPPVLFKSAALVSGEVIDGEATIDLHPPIAKAAQIPGQEDTLFLAQENDFSPLYFDNPRKLARDLERAIDQGETSFFLVLQVPEEFQGTFQLPPAIGLDVGQEIGLLERSYMSTDEGETWAAMPTVNFMFRLVFE